MEKTDEGVIDVQIVEDPAVGYSVDDNKSPCGLTANKCLQKALSELRIKLEITRSRLCDKEKELEMVITANHTLAQSLEEQERLNESLRNSIQAMIQEFSNEMRKQKTAECRQNTAESADSLLDISIASLMCVKKSMTSMMNEKSKGEEELQQVKLKNQQLEEYIQGMQTNSVQLESILKQGLEIVQFTKPEPGQEEPVTMEQTRKRKLK